MRHLPLLAVALVLAATPVAAAEPTEDPFLWLEEIDGERSMAWVVAQNTRSTGILEKVGEFEPIRSRILEIYNSKDRIPYIVIRGSHLYNFWQDAEHQRGIWRRTTLAEYRKAEPSVGDPARHRRPRRGRRREMGVQGLHLPAAGLPAVHDRAVARRQRRGRATGSSTSQPRPGSRTASRCRSRRAASTWRDADSLWVGTDFGEGTSDHFRLPAPRQALDAGHPAGGGDARVRGSRRLGHPGRGPACTTRRAATTCSPPPPSSSVATTT